MSICLYLCNNDDCDRFQPSSKVIERRRINENNKFDNVQIM